MNNMRLLTSIGGIDDDLIVRAGTDIMASQIKKDKKKTKPWIKASTIAACLALVLCFGYFSGLFGKLLDPEKPEFPDALENMIWAPHGSTSEIVDGFTEWNGLTVKMSLKNALEDTDNAGKYFAVVISKKDRSDMDNKQSSVRYLGELQEKNKNICIRMYNGYAVLFVTADELSGVKLSNLSECVFALYSRVAPIGGLLPDGGDIPDNCA